MYHRRYHGVPNHEGFILIDKTDQTHRQGTVFTRVVSPNIAPTTSASLGQVTSISGVSQKGGWQREYCSCLCELGEWIIHLLALGFFSACSIAQMILAPNLSPDNHGNMT